MTLPIVRDPTIILTNYLSYTPWLLQLKIRCNSLDLWSKVDPNSTEEATPKPTKPKLPHVSEYELPPNLRNNRNHAPTASDLTEDGITAYKNDVESYKMQLEAYKLDDKEYREEKINMDKIVMFIQSTVSPHLMRNCCQPGEPARQWIRSLMETVGVDEEEERERARIRYLNALKPMRQASNWDTWLAEYDNAATEAETEKVAEVHQVNDVKRDFLAAVMKVAPSWETSFQEVGRRDKSINRKEMMKRFREHMSHHHPKRQLNGAFADHPPDRYEATAEAYSGIRFWNGGQRPVTC
ncbi:hypothetical protein DM02DRAFT_701515 [Periconia macrospinosa]|uniref:Uncharacterized protein n=1 Tax=Periconia macrospinosa TaxID=97972 RepID=A0A2V1D3A6_9PLEO|nr:hypothetical protein DM02DRAFT_701515 [Periconia macrospinosa]